MSISHLAVDNMEASTNDSMAEINQQTQCGLFRPPQELRDMIYHHVLHTDLVEGRRIKVQNAQALAPKCPATLTCRRTQEEASSIHQAMFAAYWANDVFQFSCTDVFDLPVLTAKTVEHMTCIMRRLKLEDQSYEIRGLRSDTSHGCWGWISQHSSPQSTIDGQANYQITTKYRSGGAWRSVRVFSSRTRRWYLTWA